MLPNDGASDQAGAAWTMWRDNRISETRASALDIGTVIPAKDEQYGHVYPGDLAGVV